MYFYALKKKEKQTICNSLADRIGLPAAAIEKDWWMVQTLHLIFNMDVAEHLVFKGGSSLSKAWDIIERFSEDIDLALDREYLGYSGDITRTQVGKLRDKSFEYISKSFYPELQHQFTKAGFVDVRIQIEEIKTRDQDPLIIDFDPADSVIRKKSDNEDILLIPASVGSYSIAGAGSVATPTSQPTVSVTSAISKTPTPTKTPVPTSPTGTVSQTVTVTPTTGLPDAGVSYPTILGVCLGFVFVFIALMLAV